MAHVSHEHSPGHVASGAADPRFRAWTVILLCLAPAVSGCCLFRKSPPPPPLPRENVVEAVRARTPKLHTLVDTDISLVVTTVDEDGEHRSPTFGGIVAFDARLPGLWLRADKFGHEAFTLKAIGMQFTLAIPDTREIVTGGRIAFDKLPHLIRPSELQGFFLGPEGLGLTWPASEMILEEESYRFEVFHSGVIFREVLVDRRQLVVTTIREYDTLRRLQTEVLFADHERIDEALLPYRITIRRPRHGVGVELRLDEPELNKDLPLEAFVLRERPNYKEPVNLDYRPLEDVEAFRAEE